MKELLIYTDFVSDRLLYTLNFICNDRGVKFKICNDPQRFINEANCAKLNYANFPFTQYYPQLSPAKIIFEDDLKNQSVSKKLFEQLECLSFDEICDPIASIFYVLTRYEEYLSFPADEHDRFSAVHSIQAKYDFLRQPIADIWAVQILNFIQKTYPEFTFNKPSSKLVLSFDVDNTFAFKHKNIVQLLGGRFKDFIQGNHDNQLLRSKVLQGTVSDPNDTFDQILLYAQQGIPVKVFWHLGDFKKFDRNISWNNVVHQRLIQKMASQVQVGIHPSYFSYLNEVIVKQERGRLEYITKKPVFHSRQHFLKLRFPATFQLLSNISIKHDYSLGFADDIGFRLGTARPVPFYNLLTDEITDVMLHPFMYMDGTLNQYLKLNPDQAKVEVALLANQVKEHGGDFMCIWHNDTINDQGIWRGWKSVLEFTIDQFYAQ